METVERIRLTQLFTQLRDDSASRDSSVGELIDLFNTRGYGLLLFFLIIPSLQPIPIPGLGSAFGVLVALQGVAMIFQIRPRLPNRMARIPIKSETMRLICNGCLKVFGMVEKFVKPRLPLFAQHRFFKFLNGLLVFFGGVILALPLVLPFSNFVPAILILLICLGTLEDDGLMILLGYAYFITLCFLFSFFGPKIVAYLQTLF